MCWGCAGVEQKFDTLPGGELAFGVLGLDPLLAAAEAGAGALLFQLAQDFLHRAPQERCEILVTGARQCNRIAGFFGRKDRVRRGTIP